MVMRLMSKEGLMEVHNRMYTIAVRMQGYFRLKSKCLRITFTSRKFKFLDPHMYFSHLLNIDI